MEVIGDNLRIGAEDKMTTNHIYHPRVHAAQLPDKPAIISAATGDIITYAQMEAMANRYAHLLRGHGLKADDAVAVLLGNDPVYLPLAWASQRTGIYFVAISTKLTPPEIAYIVKDSGAKLLISCEQLAGPALEALLAPVPVIYIENDPAAGLPETPVADERAGIDMLYSSGTTGRPKGIRPALPDDPNILLDNPLSAMARVTLGMGPDDRYFGPAPLYHSAPLRWSMVIHRLGGTVILADKFDAEGSLAMIEKYKVTHSQWVPTHFVRMLKLPEEVRARYDVSSMKIALHAAAPCPVPVKSAMIEWWGPVLLEYYAGTELCGMTLITSAEWLAHKGSVGKGLIGRIEICDETGERVATGVDGLVHFADGLNFEYHNDPVKTAACRNKYGWITLGDIGHVDTDGYLYLTDRQSFMIISGGVNIYPQEVENLLVTHPAVMDAAVIGAPDDEMGERVVAVIQLMDHSNASDKLAADLTTWMRERLSGVKVPRQIDFVTELPRHPTGKLYKQVLRERYRNASTQSAR